MSRLAWAFVLLAGCAGPPASPAAEAPLPVVTATPGAPASVDLGRYLPVTLQPPPGIDVDVAPDGATSVRVDDGFRGLTLVPFESRGERFVLAVQNPAGGGSLAFRRIGLRTGDPSVLEFALAQFGLDGAAAPLTVDEDTGIVLLHALSERFPGGRKEPDGTAEAFSFAGPFRDVAGRGGYVYRQYEDGTIEILVAATVPVSARAETGTSPPFFGGKTDSSPPVRARHGPSPPSSPPDGRRGALGRAPKTKRSSTPNFRRMAEPWVMAGHSASPEAWSS